MCVCVCVFACFVYICVRPSLCLSICPFADLSTCYLCNYISIYLSVSHSMYLCMAVSIYLSICLSTYELSLCMCASVCVCVYLIIRCDDFISGCDKLLLRKSILPIMMESLDSVTAHVQRLWEPVIKDLGADWTYGSRDQYLRMRLSHVEGDAKILWVSPRKMDLYCKNRQYRQGNYCKNACNTFIANNWIISIQDLKPFRARCGS